MIPRRGNTYTLTEVMKKLDLDDQPFLLVQFDSEKCPIQLSHFDYEELLAIPEWEQTRWVYIRTTHEWIPLFECVDSKSVKDLLCIKNDSDGITISPKQYPYS